MILGAPHRASGGAALRVKSTKNGGRVPTGNSVLNLLELFSPFTIICGLVRPITSHTLAPPQGIIPTAVASQCEANSGPFLVHKLSVPPTMKIEPLIDAALMRHSFETHSYSADTAVYHRLWHTIVNVDSSGLPPIQNFGYAHFYSYGEYLISEVPRRRKNACASQLRH